MPLFDYRCPECGTVREVLVIKHDASVTCHVVHDGRLVTMEQMPSTPSFVVNGFNAANNYSGGQTYEVKTKEKDMRVIVKS